ncbi:hypothetical protein QYM36_008838 [Artemia franciscana]|uniref:Globin n=1 Tax=Artemia franciscana TaxID=6661 RepID=A0AA88I1J0_ARTSF|nr:hypothetical protein QYM36_008838 [Artemia franciscana]
MTPRGKERSFGKVLVRLLENDLGQRFSSFATRSWHKAYDVIVEYIEEGLQQSYKQDPVTGITDAEKALVQESWDLLKPDLLGLRRKIFTKFLVDFVEDFIALMKTDLGDEFTPLAESAWKKAFDIMIATIEQGQRVGS